LNELYGTKLSNMIGSFFFGLHADIFYKTTLDLDGSWLWKIVKIQIGKTKIIKL